MSNALNNQELGTTIIIYTYREKHNGTHVGGRTVNNKIVDFKEEKKCTLELMCTGANTLFAKLFDSVIIV